MIDRMRRTAARLRATSGPHGADVDDRLAAIEVAIARDDRIVRDAVADLTERIAVLERRIATLEDR